MTKYLMLVIDLLVLLLLLYRQRQIRKVSKEINFKFSLTLIIFGMYRLVNYFSNQAVTTPKLIAVIGSLLILAVGMGTIRAFTVKLWLQNNVVFRQGTWLTVGLWIVSVILHLIIDRMGQTGDATILVYFGITLTVQSCIVHYRARHSFPNT